MIHAIQRLILKTRVRFDSLYLRIFAKPRKRPDPIDIPTCFADFVERYGGEVCDNTRQTSAIQKQMADYVFRRANVVAELKCLEVDPFSSRSDTARPVEELIKAGMSEKDILDWSLGKLKLPEEVVWKMATAFRRRIEKITRKAEKQIESTKQSHDMTNARGLLLIANDNNYLFSHPQKLELISDVFARHFEESCITGFVFFSPNVPMRIPNSLREWHPWTPLYSKRADGRFVAFVNDLGHHWGKYFFSMDGSSFRDIKISDPQTARQWMDGAENVNARKL